MITFKNRLSPGAGAAVFAGLTSLSRKLVDRFHIRADSDSRIDPVMEQLEAARDGMTLGATKLEEEFLKIITDLDSQSTLSTALVEQSEKLISYVTGQMGADIELQRAVELLGQPLGFVRDGHERTSRVIERLRHHRDQMNHVRKHEGLLHGTVAPLNYIQTLFRVESATLPHDVQNIFTGLTKDIESLQNRVTHIFGEQFQSLAKARQTIDRLVERLAQQTAQQEKASREKQEFISSSIEELRCDMADNQKRDVRLTKSSRSVRNSIGQIVVGMQFQDITRQKMEHVREAVDEMLERYAGIRKNADKPKAPGELRFLREAARLQISQLEAVKTELAEAESQTRESFVALARDTADIDHESVTLGSFKSMSAAEDGMVQSLLTIIAELRLLIAGTVAIQQEAYETIRPLGNLASNLTGDMRQISVNIKLIALNAQIQAAQVGQGTGLEVLSERTSVISDEIYALNENVSIDLDGMAVGLEEIVAEFRSLSDNGQAQRRLLNEEGGEEEERLHAYRDATLQSFMAVSGTAAGLADSIQSTIDSIRFSSLADTMLQPLLEALQGVVTAVDGSGITESRPEDLSLTEHLRSNYTMATEHKVHSPVSTRQTSSPLDVPSSNDFDLFAEPDATVPVNRSQSESATQLAKEIEFF
jgi:hypothetical protein